MVNVAAPVATALVRTAGARLGSEVVDDGLERPVNELLVLLVPVLWLALGIIVAPDPVTHRVRVFKRREQCIDNIAGQVHKGPCVLTKILIVRLGQDGLATCQLRDTLALIHRGAHEVRPVRPSGFGTIRLVRVDVERRLDEVDELKEPH